MKQPRHEHHTTRMWVSVLLGIVYGSVFLCVYTLTGSTTLDGIIGVLLAGQYCYLDKVGADSILRNQTPFSLDSRRTLAMRDGPASVFYLLYYSLAYASTEGDGYEQQGSCNAA